MWSRAPSPDQGDRIPRAGTVSPRASLERLARACASATAVSRGVFCSGRLRIAAALPEADTLVRELLAFQVKITAAAHDTYGAWREGTHDDLVLAVALACWHAESRPPCWIVVG